MYPIKIERLPQYILLEEYHVFPSNKFRLSDLNFVGDRSFTIEQIESDGSSGCVVTVERVRLETDLEVAARVAKEEAYMKEYNKRNKKNNPAN